MQKYDAVVGDTTIIADCSLYVDFTLPYSESGVSMIVLTEDSERNSLWIFLKPLSLDLWLTTGVAFIFTGFVIWLLEHRENTEFRSPAQQQLGMIFWFSFSTLVFAHNRCYFQCHTSESGEQLVKVCADYMGFCGTDPNRVTLQD
ncbi:glutamate receptor 2.9-like isoform X2 [Rosa chinensis]|uniref:glutamate receptor 2.9-like isoform X2 n=1 Tax=Rosa chinensis TaxID=74649 RepID=UPI001AD8E5C8|nr:glutamate receptor 2.9-like isoform X2 [Rosa chinensis]